MLTFKKKVFLLFITVVFSLGAIGSLGVGTAQASIFDFIRAFVTINPLAVQVTAPSEADISQVFKVEANVINKGAVKIENVTAEIFLPAGLSIVGKSKIKNIGIVPAGKEKKTSWQIKGIEIGNFFILVKASGVVKGDAVSAEGNTVLIAIKEKSPPPGKSKNIFQSFFSFFQRWF